MTRVLVSITREDGPLFFDCMGHAPTSDVCVAISTLCSMLVLHAVEELGIDPVIQMDGHVRISIDNSNIRTNEVFRAAERTFKWLEEEHPDDIKVY